MVKKIPTKEVKGALKHPQPVSERLEEYIELLGDGDRELIGIKTGETALDRALLGLDGVIVLGGKAGGGKTTLAMHLAMQVARNGTPVLFYSLEMPLLAILTKMLSSLSKVGYGDILLKGKTAFREGDKYPLSESNTEALKKGKEELDSFADLITIKTKDIKDGEISFETVKADIEYLQKKFKTERVLVVVDHMQLFTPSTDTKDQIEREQNLINGFKEVSTNTKATILLISQQNKASYNRATVTSIKGSVDIIYLADVVMFIKRVEEEEEEERDQFAEVFNEEAYTDMRLVIDKNRYNAPKTLNYKFNAQHSLIEFENGKTAP